MKLMDICTIYPHASTSVPCPQDRQFTSKDFTDMLIGDDESNPLVRISRDGHPHSSLDYKQPSKLYYKNAA